MSEQANFMMKMPGGICYAHGPYEADNCPKWPACATDEQDPVYIAMGRLPIDPLQARLSRYETAMREALNANGAPLGAWQDPRMALLAAGNRTDRVHEILRAALSDQPAAEPAESKLEAMRGLLESWRCVGHDEEDYNMGVRRCIDDLEAILDAQPSTPEPKGE